MQAANAYQRQQVMTASPEELTLMLYNGAIRFVTEAVQGVENNEMEKAHRACMRAQNIVYELMITTNTDYEIGKSWVALDEYIIHCLTQGNVKKDKELLEQAKAMLIEFRNVWVEAMKIARQAKAAGGE